MNKERTIFYKSYRNIKNKTRQLSLSNLIDKRIYHTERGWIDINYGETFNKVLNDIKNDLGFRENNTKYLENCGRFERVVYSYKRKQWNYIVGQSYPEEIRYLRKLLE